MVGGDWLVFKQDTARPLPASGYGNALLFEVSHKLDRCARACRSAATDGQGPTRPAWPNYD